MIAYCIGFVTGMVLTLVAWPWLRRCWEWFRYVVILSVRNVHRWPWLWVIFSEYHLDYSWFWLLRWRWEYYRQGKCLCDNCGRSINRNVMVGIRSSTERRDGKAVIVAECWVCRDLPTAMTSGNQCESC